ncbi:MAG TPA: hypothetical protein VJ857_00520 [Methanocorpusculum sp.]|nr:hypothetical protein [Methanocorpusculum sp.]HJJ49922.1 hypothetical protein [Methanocorpusculum sp.]HKL97134.1 hypothetical protein [Methanocorpusculum sp.]
MVDKRTITIGVTINLGNYESLRVEVSDIAENETAARDLVDFLGKTLDEFGTLDATTRAAIEKYKHRVLDRYAQDDGDTEEYAVDDMPLSPSIEEDEEDIPMEVLEDTRDVVPISEESEPEFLGADEIPVSEAPEYPVLDQIPAFEAPAPEGEFVCEKCGVPISKVQRDVSNLFMGRNLCKKCMK